MNLSQNFMGYASGLNNLSLITWQTSGITDMSNMFYNNRVFNQPIGVWNVRNVTNMNNTFNFCTAFDQNLSGWNIAGLNSAGTIEDVLALPSLTSFGFSASLNLGA